jgi:predicted dehydrogenase
MNHTHAFGSAHAVSQIKIEGTRGAAIAKMGVNLNYPHGEPDTLQLCLVSDEPPAPSPQSRSWTDIPLRGSWFLEAFEGPMANLQRVVSGEDAALVSSIEDAFGTMAVVEAAYESSAAGGTPIARD